MVWDVPSPAAKPFIFCLYTRTLRAREKPRGLWTSASVLDQHGPPDWGILRDAMMPAQIEHQAEIAVGFLEGFDGTTLSLQSQGSMPSNYYVGLWTTGAFWLGLSALRQVADHCCSCKWSSRKTTPWLGNLPETKEPLSEDRSFKRYHSE